MPYRKRQANWLTLFHFACATTGSLSATEAEPISWKAQGAGGAIAAGARESVAAGMEILSDGGNAADSAVATILALAVTDYGSFAIGGEVPLMIYDAERGEVKVLSGVGGATLDPASIQWYYDHGIPSDGSMKSAPVPGAVHLCVTALIQYGTMSFERVVQPTLGLLEPGREPWHHNLLKTLQKLVGRERETDGDREAN